MVFIGDHVATVLVTEGRTASRQTERNSCCPAKVTHLSGQSPTNFALPFEMRKLSSKKSLPLTHCIPSPEEKNLSK
jgi:hypothetical protein